VTGPSETDSPTARPRAVVVAVQLSGVTDEDHESSLAELERLADTLGLEVVARVTQKRDALASAGVLGDGKLAELAKLTGGTGDTGPKIPRKQSKARARMPGAKVDDAGDDEQADAGDAKDDAAESGDAAAPARRPTVVIVDHDLTPSQARNLERATGAEVLDRSSVILGIFHRHAHTREARLQVEIARLVYLTPRLRETHAGGDRQRGGIGGKGAGESALELDKRRVRDRIAELRAQLAAIEKETETRRGRRALQSTVALVGYTNAGKSSLFRALTGSDVYVADKLFATLDTTVRTLHPETKPHVLVSDTVGFIKKLPHDLVASFRSTLAEAREADLLLHLVDASDPACGAQIAVTREVLAELGAVDTPRWLVLNKIDRCDTLTRRALAARYPEGLQLSAHDPADVAELHRKIVEFFERGAQEAEIFVPHSAQRLVGRVHEDCRVLSETWDERGATFRVRAAPQTLEGLLRSLAELSPRMSS